MNQPDISGLLSWCKDWLERAQRLPIPDDYSPGKEEALKNLVPYLEAVEPFIPKALPPKKEEPKKEEPQGWGLFE